MSEEFEILGLEEVAIAVKSTEDAKKLFNKLFNLEFKRSWILINERIKVVSTRIGDVQLQFIEPLSKESVVYKFLEKRGEGIHHIALKVKNLDKLVEKLNKLNIKLIPEKPVEIENPVNKGKVRYIFIHPKYANGVLIELIEFKEES